GIVLDDLHLDAELEDGRCRGQCLVEYGGAADLAQRGANVRPRNAPRVQPRPPLQQVLANEVVGLSPGLVLSLGALLALALVELGEGAPAALCHSLRLGVPVLGHIGAKPRGLATSCTQVNPTDVEPPRPAANVVHEIE